MQQQQVSTLQIRALGALCRLLSQVWRGRIALAIPKLHKVWTKYAANLFCADLEKEKKTLQESAVPYLYLSLVCFGCNSGFFIFLNFRFISSSEVQLNTYVLVQMVILTGPRVPSKQQRSTRHSIKKKAIQQAQSQSQGQRESVSIGTGITNLGGIGKTNSKQVYYIWRAIFTASTKRTQKVLYLTT